MTDSSAYLYFDSDRLLQGCLQIVEEKFRQLRADPANRLPHGKVIVSKPNSYQFELYFPESGRSCRTVIHAKAFASAIGHHYRAPEIRLALWARMPAESFLELLCGLRSCGHTLVSCHEEHAVVAFQLHSNTSVKFAADQWDRRLVLPRERVDLPGLV
jgi:hypothetical protein